MALYSEKIEALIAAALADGVLTDKEREILLRKAEAEGIDLDEFEMVLDARLAELEKKEEEKETVAAEAKKKKQNSDKHGELRKCPACGAPVPAFKGVCPECGYEFAGVEANSSATQLAQAIRKAKSADAKKEAVETFPIPNTKGDLLEFLTSLKPRISDASDPLSGSYFKKYTECIEKAKVSYPNDKMLIPFINDYATLVSSVKKSNRLSWIKRHKVVVGLAALFLIYLCINLASHISESIKKNNEVKKAAELLEEGNLDNLLEYAKDCKSLSFTQKKDVINEFLAQGRVDDAAVFFDGAGHVSMYDIQWEYKNSKEAIDYATSVAEKLRYSFYSIGEYEAAWKYHPLRYSTITNAGNAESRYQFMVEATKFILKNKGKTDARIFVKEGSEWFRTYVDNDKNGEEYSQFNYKAAKQKLDTIVNEY